MRPELPTGTVTFLFTDIEGSTRLLHALGPERVRRALAEHRRVLREAFAAYEGVEVDTQGDAFFVAFPTAPGAAAAAADGAAPHSTPGPIRVRIGLHTGAPTSTGRVRRRGRAPRRARSPRLAHGGQVIALADDGGAARRRRRLLDLGAHRLKDFDGAVRLLQHGAGTSRRYARPGASSCPRPVTHVPRP